MRRAVSFFILLFWLVMLGLLVRRSWVSAPPAPPPAVRSMAADREEWMSVYHQTSKVGYTHLSFAAEADGFRFSDDSLLRLVVMETTQTVRVRLQGHARPDWSLRDVEFELSSGAGHLRARGVVEPAGLRLSIQSGSETTEQLIPLAQPLYLPTTLQASLNASMLQPGHRFEVAAFDPISLKNDRLAVVVEGQEPLPGGGIPPVRAWRVRQEFRGFTTTAWTDAEGTVLREEGPMGMVLVRTTAEEAMQQNWSEAVAHDLVASAAIPVARPIASPRERRTLRVRVSGLALETIPLDDEQSREGDVLSVRRSGADRRGAYPLPCGDSRFAPDLQPTAFLQSDHPRLRDLAREIVGSERTAAAAAGLLNDWVYDHLRKVPTVSIPNALQVLDMGEGDCNEHAVLLAALGRAAGIPSRLAAGVVYLDGAFLYHAWCEMWLGRWVAVDPALHQLPADATHIKLVEGGPDEQLAMINVIGHLGIEVLEDTAEPSAAASSGQQGR